MSEELIRKVCEAANCKYPDMEAMADFKREVTPSVVIGLLDGLRHAKGLAAINDARANGTAETVHHLRSELAALRATHPAPESAGGVEAVEAVEVVAHMWQHEETGRIGFVEQQQIEWGFEKNNPRLNLCGELMTVAQHDRIMAATVPAGCKVVPVVPTEIMRKAAQDKLASEGLIVTDWLIHTAYSAMIDSTILEVKDE